MGPRGLQDLQGLLQVLHHDPFSDGRAWSHCVSTPYLSGDPGSRRHSQRRDLPVQCASVRCAAVYGNAQIHI